MAASGTPPIPRLDEWTAAWIEPVEAVDGPARQRPAYHLAGEFRLRAAVESAYLHATAHGLYEAFINGSRVGDCELTPGFTAYRKRLQVQTFDVTALLAEGRNALGAILSDGWWRGQHGVARRVNDYGDTTAFLAQLVVTLALGRCRDRRHRLELAIPRQPHPARGSDRRRGARPTAARCGLGRTGYRPLVVGCGARRRARLSHAVHNARSAGAARRGAPAGFDPRARPAAAGRGLRPEQQRLGAPARSRAEWERRSP